METVVMPIIELDNNYYLQILDNIKKLPIDAIDIQNLKLKNIRKNRKILLKIDFNNLEKNKYKKIIKNLLHIKKKIARRKITIGEQEENSTKKLLGYVIDYDENDKEQKFFIQSVNAVFYNTRYERYNYIYDTACDYLDSFFYGKNLCDFKNNQCGEKRNTSSLIGCCHHFKNKYLGPLTKLVPCEHLKEDHTCGAKCIGCKLFTCDYLRKKGVQFKIKDILLLDAFFDPLQKYFIKTMVFTPKEKIIKRLMHT